jgi:hypothetical protein
MAAVHVNSANGAPVSPYDTWAKAATTLAAAAAVAVAGDEVFVHPSHAETVGTTCTWAGTKANPIRIICGTPGATSGITALQNTAQWGYAISGSACTWNGSIYVHGIQFKALGSTSGSAGLMLSSTMGHAQHYNDCSFQHVATGTGYIMSFHNNSAAVDDGDIKVTNSTFRWAAAAQSFRMFQRTTFSGMGVVAGSATPTTAFYSASSTADNSGLIEMNGLDLSALSSGFSLFTPTQKPSQIRVRNAKLPSGWTPGLFATTPICGSRGELLNYGTGDTNYKFYTSDHWGIAQDEVTIKRTTNPASDGTTSYSMKLTTTANVGHPSSVFRSPPIIKRHAAAPGTTRTVSVQIAHDGASAFTDKEVWIELEYLGTAGFPLALFATDQSNYTTAAAGQPASGIAWDGASGTGPNGSSTWHRLQLETPAITVEEEGYLIATVCMSVPSKTIFADPQLNVTVV